MNQKVKLWIRITIFLLYTGIGIYYSFLTFFYFFKSVGFNNSIISFVKYATSDFNSIPFDRFNIIMYGLLLIMTIYITLLLIIGIGILRKKNWAWFCASISVLAEIAGIIIQDAILGISQASLISITAGILIDIILLGLLYITRSDVIETGRKPGIFSRYGVIAILMTLISFAPFLFAVYLKSGMFIESSIPFIRKPIADWTINSESIVKNGLKTRDVHFIRILLPERMSFFSIDLMRSYNPSSFSLMEEIQDGSRPLFISFNSFHFALLKKRHLTDFDEKKMEYEHNWNLMLLLSRALMPEKNDIAVIKTNRIKILIVKKFSEKNSPDYISYDCEIYDPAGNFICNTIFVLFSKSNTYDDFIKSALNSIELKDKQNYQDYFRQGADFFASKAYYDAQFCFFNCFQLNGDIGSGLFLVKSMIRIGESNKKIRNELAITRLLEEILKQDKNNKEAKSLLDSIRTAEAAKQSKPKQAHPLLHR
jgi:hypothetical protein